MINQEVTRFTDKVNTIFGIAFNRFDQTNVAIEFMTISFVLSDFRYFNGRVLKSYINYTAFTKVLMDKRIMN